MSDSCFLPTSLLSKLNSEQSLVFDSLASDETDKSLPIAKDHIKRRLIAGTPKALDTVELVMMNAGPKERLAAASKWLDLSPIVEQSDRSLSAPVLPIEALKVIFDGMASMFGVQQVPMKQAVEAKAEEIKVEPVN